MPPNTSEGAGGQQATNEPGINNGKTLTTQSSDSESNMQHTSS